MPPLSLAFARHVLAAVAVSTCVLLIAKTAERIIVITLTAFMLCALAGAPSAACRTLRLVAGTTFELPQSGAVGVRDRREASGTLLLDDSAWWATPGDARAARIDEAQARVGYERPLVAAHGLRKLAEAAT